MRKRWWVGAAALVMGIALAVSAGMARAEAPFFYEDLTVASIYDPGFDPLSRQDGLLSVLGQAWSQPDAVHPGEGVASQDYAAQYRLRWLATLDPRYSLLVELKASSRDRVVDEDYFVRSEFVVQGLRAPMWVYGGIRVPEKDDFMVYAGAESMSRRLRDFFPGFPLRVPAAFRGYAEVRYDLDEHDPTLRLTTLAHTIPGWGVPRLTLGVALDGFFREGTTPHWVLQGHADYLLTRGMTRVSVVSGYAVALQEDGEQRASLGLRVGVF